MSKNSLYRAGGSATAGGMNFQAAVTTITLVHMCNGMPLKWLEGLINDTPVEIAAETGGAGDDLRITLADSKLAEVQVKKGLQKGKMLWEALDKLSQAISSNEIQCGILVVCPNSSSTVREQLALDIQRIGNGRTDNLKPIGLEFHDRLISAGFSAENICHRLRIVSVHALSGLGPSIIAARSILENVCAHKHQIDAAWNCLLKEAAAIIEHRSKRTITSVLNALQSENIGIREHGTPGPVTTLSAITKWTIETNETFHIWGMDQDLKFDESWIDIPIVSSDQTQEELEKNVAETLNHYHGWTTKKHNDQRRIISPVTLGRFFRHCVVVSGPGMGKSTLLSRLALQYAREGYLVAKINLRLVAQRMRAKGDSFTECIFELGFGNSDTGQPLLRKLDLSRLVLLCDALDECGNDQKIIVNEIRQFSSGHPNSRIIVTTRPLSYRKSVFPDWRHYEILPLEENRVSQELSKLIERTVGANNPGAAAAKKYANDFFDKNPVRDLIARSPLLLCLVASLSIRGITFDQSKSALYSEIFRMFDDEPSDKTGGVQIAKPLLHRILDILAYNLLKNPTADVAIIQKACATSISNELNCPHLQAETYVCDSVDLWLKIGVLEKLYTSGFSLLTFVHRTFAEYAAARYLSSLTAHSLNKELPNLFKIESFSEALSFAAEMANAETICTTLLKGSSLFSDTENRLKTCIHIAAVSSPPLSDALLSEVASEAANAIQSDNQQLALSLGSELGRMSRRFPSLMEPFIQTLIQHKNNWTSLVSWHCALSTQLGHYDISALAAQLGNMLQVLRPLKPNLGGGLTIGTNNNDLYIAFVALASKAFLVNLPEKEAIVALRSIFGDDHSSSYGAHQVLYTLLETLEKKHLYTQIVSSNIFEDPKMHIDWERSTDQLRKAFEKIFEVLADGTNTSNKTLPQHCYNVGAFLELTRFWEQTPYQTHRWLGAKHDNPAKTTFQVLVKASCLDGEMLRLEAATCQELYASQEKFRVSELSEIAPHTDVPEPNWHIQLTSKEGHLLEKACHHSSVWVANTAAWILFNVSDAEQLTQLSKRLVRDVKGDTLFVILQYARELKDRNVTAAVLNRATNCTDFELQFLLDYLHDVEIPWSEDLFGVIRHGLFCTEPVTAAIAAQLGASVSSDGHQELHDELKLAFKHWLEKEEPYPSGRGIIPKSPREEILEALFQMQPPTYSELKLHLQDSRSDVQSLAEKKLYEILEATTDKHGQFIQDILSNQIPNSTIRFCIDEGLHLSVGQVKNLLTLLKSKDDETRYAIMPILDLKYLSSEEIERICLELIEHDSHPQIQRRTKSILDELK